MTLHLFKPHSRWLGVWDIRLTCQPPSSSDLNVQKVDEAYQNYPVDRSNCIFLTEQVCMMEIMKHNGGQHYNIPQMKKTMELQGCLPITLKSPLQLHNQAMQFISG